MVVELVEREQQARQDREERALGQARVDLDRQIQAMGQRHDRRTGAPERAGHDAVHRQAAQEPGEGRRL